MEEGNLFYGSDRREINPYTDFGFISEYEESIKVYRDLKNSMDTALRKGREEGFLEGMEKGAYENNLANARKMKSLGIDMAVITQVTGLTEEMINAL